MSKDRKPVDSTEVADPVEPPVNPAKGQAALNLQAFMNSGGSRTLRRKNEYLVEAFNIYCKNSGLDRVMKTASEWEAILSNWCDGA